MTVPERISALRALMEEKGYDAYLIPTDDNHQSEYVGEHFKARAFMTGFTGSAGTAVITKTEAGLWTDGRYFIQAANQLEGSGVTLFKMGQPDVPTLEDYIADVIPEGGTLGFDGRVVAMGEGQALMSALLPKNGKIDYSADLVDKIWEDRPPLSEKPAFALGIEYTGESTADKLTRIREAMKQEGANVHILAALDDICWTTNLRGDDIEYFPLLLSYAIITMEDMKLYVDERKLTAEMKETLAKDGISIRPYNAVYEDVKNLKAEDSVLVDPSRLNYALYNNIPKGAKVIEKMNPEVLMKAMKNDTELKNIINAHIKDGVAVTRFMYWLKKNIGKTKITEISAAEKLDSFRKEQEGYLWQSFEPICGSGEHAAIVHYAATPETNVPVTTNGLFLTDTGGGYMEGSTDITRTFAFGEITDRMKEDFTTVLLCNLHLARAVFPHGISGFNLDAMARMPAWERGLDYNHGTGHGVGYLMNIHEAPAGFRCAVREKEKAPLEAGMVITNEPGLYIEGSHGIRTENELVIRKGPKTEYGQFLYFEPITYVPIDLDAVKPDMMRQEDKEQLNAYHAKVYELISPHLNDEEREWLKEYTRAI
ncbi:MAG: aminopeptidase P family protein [Dorea sp.]|jgi:Xaa-Pro aminopeptidase|uniref:aminopeptidase P family protein n=1 Tax=Sporofaciens musculi TaxID=2681861 RepID=UPI00216C80F3|nr:aminopeptidase P family protein [Sporofaciens musculi]MCI9423355.1 aminopeptidase P family protein [Dorea sp.]